MAEHVASRHNRWVALKQTTTPYRWPQNHNSPCLQVCYWLSWYEWKQLHSLELLGNIDCNHLDDKPGICQPEIFDKICEFLLSALIVPINTYTCTYTHIHTQLSLALPWPIRPAITQLTWARCCIENNRSLEPRFAWSSSLPQNTCSCNAL
jgi:hypothetical protein